MFRQNPFLMAVSRPFIPSRTELPVQRLQVLPSWHLLPGWENQESRAAYTAQSDVQSRLLSKWIDKIVFSCIYIHTASQELEVHKSNNSLAHEIAENCVAVRIRKLNRMVTSLYDGCFRDFGLTVAQFNLLVAIGSFDKVSPKTVGQILSLEKSSLSRNIEKMKTKGWVEILPAQDLRSHDLVLTPSGAVLLKQAKPAWDQAQVKSKEMVSNDLQSLLAKINRI